MQRGAYEAVVLTLLRRSYETSGYKLIGNRKSSTLGWIDRGSYLPAVGVCIYTLELGLNLTNYFHIKSSQSRKRSCSFEIASLMH